MEGKQFDIRIEIGECLLEAINNIVDNCSNSSEIGLIIKEAFGIDFTKIVEDKYLEIKK
jgi:hypothetical protein